MQRRAIVPIAFVAIFGLGACGNSGGTSDTAPTVQPIESSAESLPPEETPTGESETTDDTNVRGNIVLDVNETGTLSNEAGEEVASFVVKSIEPGTCTEEFAEEAENGTILFVTMEAEVAPQRGEDFPVTMNTDAFTWGYISPEGTTFNGDMGSIATYSCLPESETIPSTIGQGEKAVGIVVLDAPADSGSLVYAPDGFTSFELEY